MQPREIKAIRHLCFRDGRKRFSYYRDRYAAELLRALVTDGTPLREVSRGRCARLLSRPAVKSHVAKHCGDGRLHHDALLGLWPQGYETFWLTAGHWLPDYYCRGHSQISRPGGNLVLQLNFSAQHDAPYRRLVRPVGREHPFAFMGHPVREDAITLAWSRVDVDLDHDEALIEELQCDWIRHARSVADWTCRMQRTGGERELLFGRVDGCVDGPRLRRYVEDILWRYEKVWAEAMLWATLWILRGYLGVKRVYLHTPESGRIFKAPVQKQPPRSLYTQLPRSFCFETTHEAPALLRSCQDRFVRSLVAANDNVAWNALQF